MFMKRFFLFVAVLATFTGISANAQTARFGVFAGFTSSNSSVKNFDSKSVSLYQAGVACNIPIAVGFAVQPALVYQVKGASLDKMAETGFEASLQSLKTEVGFLELPVQIQWGPDLLAFRPYVFAEPFIGIGVNTKNTSTTIESIKENVNDFSKSALNRLEYGLGVGAGLEVWKVQLSVRYFWNFGTLYKEGDSASDTANTVAQTVKAAFKDNKNFNGITASLAFFF